MLIELIWRIVAAFGLGMVVGSWLTIALLRPELRLARRYLEHRQLTRTPAPPPETER
jgi:hypothetical protein